jgi:hypothetical protein
MLKSTLYILLLLSCFVSVKAQTNLVPNPSFEIHDSCPNNINQITYALPWIQPTTGNPDYCNACDDTTNPSYVGVPANVWGYQYARTGVAYADFTAYYYGGPPVYREYIETKLTTTLTANQKYYVSMYVSLTDSSVFAVDGMGLYFSQNEITRSDFNAFGFIPQIQNPHGNILSDKINWIKISGTYTATGNEQYITIGNFKNDSTTDTLRVRPNLSDGFGGAYNAAQYYVDDVCISTDSLTCNTTVGIKTITNNQAIFYYDTYNKKIVIKENGIYTLQITNEYGNKMYNNLLQGYQNIDVSGYETGCFIITLYNKQGISFKKIIINP